MRNSKRVLGSLLLCLVIVLGFSLSAYGSELIDSNQNVDLQGTEEKMNLGEPQIPSLSPDLEDKMKVRSEIFTTNKCSIPNDAEAAAKIMENWPVSIVDNPQMFRTSSTYENWTKMWEVPDSSTGTYSSFYGLVKGYYANNNDSNYDTYALEMTSNVIGRRQYVNGEYTGKVSGISEFRWRVDADTNQTWISRWNPHGTDTNDGQTINATLAPVYNGVQLGSVGTDFSTWKDKITAYAGQDQNTNHPYYDVMWQKNVNLFNDPVLYPDVVYLNAAVEFTANEGAYFSWTWNWNWMQNYWYND